MNEWMSHLVEQVTGEKKVEVFGSQSYKVLQTDAQCHHLIGCLKPFRWAVYWIPFKPFLSPPSKQVCGCLWNRLLIFKHIQSNVCGLSLRQQIIPGDFGVGGEGHMNLLRAQPECADYCGHKCSHCCVIEPDVVSIAVINILKPTPLPEGQACTGRVVGGRAQRNFCRFPEDALLVKAALPRRLQFHSMASWSFASGGPGARPRHDLAPVPGVTLPSLPGSWNRRWWLQGTSGWMGALWVSCKGGLVTNTPQC